MGVPGPPRLLEVMHTRHGKLPWADAVRAGHRAGRERLAPFATRAGDDREGQEPRGEPGGPRLFFTADGQPHPAGARLRNPEYAKTLRTLAAKGMDAFYTGEIAGDIVKAVTGHPVNPGTLSLADLADYRVRDVEPLCGRLSRLAPLRHAAILVRRHRRAPDAGRAREP